MFKTLSVVSTTVLNDRRAPVSSATAPCVNDALWDEIRCRQTGAEETRGEAADRPIAGRSMQQMGGEPLEQHGSELTYLHAYCVNL